MATPSGSRLRSEAVRTSQSVALIEQLEQSALVSRLAASQPALVANATAQRQSPSVRQRQTQRRLTKEQTQQLGIDYESGASMQELAARWSLHRTTVAAQLRQAGVPLRRQGIPADRLAEAIKLYGEGWSGQR